MVYKTLYLAEVKAMLREMSNRTGLSESAIARAAIIAVYRMWVLHNRDPVWLVMFVQRQLQEVERVAGGEKV